ncbi:alpha/beta hydrolase [Undibacterium sp. CY18W]|uniref:Alpha/beta hydrolase n=1 Tax=Undibacterium hunanense TaxID=2762292 RepID=A0ABR6ZS76_9BURK|nr:alpha/beta fold hydrolase [Undibacterium hunanense]MBC3918731.1 alpha/beta hydrolase [Undibacterium hunanense]
MRLILSAVLSIVCLSFYVDGMAAEPPVIQMPEQDMVLATDTGKIAGSLLLPAGAGQAKVPVVLIIAGSGPTDRDGNTVGMKGKNNSLKMLAQDMAAAGFASLRFDKRGIAASSAAATSESALRFETYVQDAVAWLKLLKTDVRFSGVAVLGHSEGSLIAILSAQQVKVGAVISVAGPAKNAGDILRQQFQGKLPPLLTQKNEDIISALQAGKLISDVPPELKAFYRDSVQPYLVSWFRYTPENEIGKLTCPVLLLQGDNDIQVDAKQLTALKTAKPDATQLLVHNMNHVLKIVTGDMSQQMASYGDPGLPLAPELSSALTRFLRDKLQ